MTERSFEDRRRERSEKALGERDMAQALRRARCPVCQKPMLWHGEPGQPGTGTVSCKLDQGEVWELVQAKPVEAGAPDPRAGVQAAQIVDAPSAPPAELLDDRETFTARGREAT